MNIQAYTATAPIIDQEDEDTYNTTLIDVDETLFWGQFNVAQVLDQFDFEEILDYVHANNGENE
jgi:hypothetical protein